MDFTQIASAWLTKFSHSLEQQDAASCASLFHSHGWLRDYLNANIKSTTISGLEVTSDGSFKPSPGEMPESGIFLVLRFSTAIASGRGIFTVEGRLRFFISLDSLKGHEPRGPEEGVYHGTATYWSEVREERRRTIEGEPVVGAGQNGLQVAARFKQMGIPTLVIEKNERIGDHWRRRYPCLTLHTPKLHHSLLYQPYPDTWPRFTPRDKVADWLEQYAISQDIVVWTKSQPLPVPSYDSETKRWTVSIDRNGKSVTIHPKHIVLATDVFKGQIFHSESYSGGPQFAGKRVVIVGTGNSGADIALDLHMREAQAVTILQRSTTVVQSANTLVEMLDHLWDPNLPVEVGDYRNVATPYRLLKEILISRKDHFWDKDRDILDGLAKAGMNVNIDGGGILTLVHERLGGMDIGTAEHVASGKIKVKSEVNAVILSDGSVLEADVVLFATGYRHMQSIMRRIFGETIDQAGPAGGMDEEGEMRGAYKPTGHPGLWYALGDFSELAFWVQAIQLQALELGYTKM
ncbi:hypothetical protein BDP27DRAFT_1386030 [Rhodocollybia butyracea]|uniref:Flavin-containing monooxygenase n=1 Tax=Rhodocollybia butyracea TaxID=206335 RepID=A0A9P5PAD9_9AGAR|nr:hypothetical protein BDP27DRAFT_1386030 [Rhodocollybia butyracea]